MYMYMCMYIHVYYVCIYIYIYVHIYICPYYLHSWYCMHSIARVRVMYNECKTTFERNHRLVDGILCVRTVGFQKPALQLGDHWKYLLQPMISRLIPRRQSRIVGKVEVA